MSSKGHNVSAILLSILNIPYHNNGAVVATEHGYLKVMVVKLDITSGTLAVLY